MRDPRNAEMMGLIPRAIDEIFELAHKRSITDFQVHCSFVQIYNENLYDMLRYPMHNSYFVLTMSQTKFDSTLKPRTQGFIYEHATVDP